MSPGGNRKPIQVTIDWDGRGSDQGFLVTPLGKNRYRVEEDPQSCMIAENLRDIVKLPRYGDVIEARWVWVRKIRFIRVVERARFKRSCHVISQALIDSPELERVLEKVMDQDGYWERVAGGILTVYLPKDCSYDMWADLEEMRQRRV